ncbi:MAG: pyruvate kinase [Verrucomicrobia bacterium]|nr:pyruvate kinase [Verrucomicrobiota bacterium]
MQTRTKIICTIGPAVGSYEKIVQLIDAGMNVARLNFSHGTHADHLKTIQFLKKARAEKKTPLAIMLDTKGPEIRLGMVKGDQFPVQKSQRLLLTKEEVIGDENRVQVTPSIVVDTLEVGMRVLIDDGYLITHVVEKNKEGVVVAFENPGLIKSQKGVNVPGVDIALPAMTEQDVDDITFGCEQDVDLIAASFIRSADHILEIKSLLAKQKKSETLVIAKIENSLGVQNFDGIIQAADGIMVARGDLGVELPLKEVPRLQKMMIRKCYQSGKPVITATQMLESMIKNPRPTRAEVSDVANAIYDSTSAVMLSGETAVGAYPIETVQMMKSIVEEAEKDFNYRDFFNRDSRTDFNDVSNSVALASVKTAYSAQAKGIFCFTNSGFTARVVSRFRPEMPIVALTPNPKIYNQMALNWGIIPVDPATAKNAQDAMAITSCFALKQGIVRYGDLVVVTAGAPFGVSGTTNMMLVESIGDVLVRGHSRPGRRVHGKITLLHAPDEKRHAELKERIVVISRCDDSYLPLLKNALGIVLQNHPDDTDSENYALQVAKMLDVPILTRADGAMSLLTDGQMVTLDPQKGIVYKGSIMNDDEMIPTICSPA